MKFVKYTAYIAAAAALASCSDIDNLQPQGGSLLAEQVKEINAILPQRAEATFTGMYVKLGQPLSLNSFSSERPDDFAFIMMAFSNDLEGADIVIADSGYNWFSVCGDLTSTHGNVQVSLIESEKLFSALVKDKLAARKAAGTYNGKFSPLHHFLGYEGRCAFPSNFDSDYCYSLFNTEF